MARLRAAKTRTSKVDVRVSSSEEKELWHAARLAGHVRIGPWIRDTCLIKARARTDPSMYLLALFSPTELEQIRNAAKLSNKDPAQWARTVLLWWAQEPKCLPLFGPNEKPGDFLSTISNGSPEPYKSESLASTMGILIDAIERLTTSLIPK